jgi:O-acetyl-ADP-ribose deacetylase (regulator of RNase III)
MVKDFRHWCHNRNPKPGEAWLWSGAGGVRIASLLTQPSADANHGHHPGKAHTEYVNHALKALCHVIEKENLTSIALPRLATGVGGLDWAEVKPLIEQRLGGLEIPVIVYSEYHAGVAAEEGLEVAKA